jgi:hypothetical protein
MVQRLQERFAAAGLDLACTAGSIVRHFATLHQHPPGDIVLQERHIARAFQEAFFRRVSPARRNQALSAVLGVASTASPRDGVAVQEEIRSQLMKAGRPAFVEEGAVSFQEGYLLVLELGGIPCYPVLADGAKPLCEFEDPPEALADRVLASGIYCVEFIPRRNTPEVLERYVACLRAAGLIVTGGTEHNTTERIPLEPRCRGDDPLPEFVRRTFWEGACVVAAHQWLARRGEPGYIGQSGRPNPDFTSHEALVSHLRGLGETLIAASATHNVAAAMGAPA